MLLIEAFEIILWAARRKMGGDEDLAPVAERVRDWKSVVEFAANGGVIPLLARALRQEPAVPLAVRRDLDKRYTIKAGHNAVLARELREILADFRTAGIEALAYKGPALAMLAYGELSLRNPSSDIDLLLHGADIQRAKDRLQSLGYRLILSPEQEQHYLKHRYHLHFERQGPELHVELHWALTPAYWPFPLDVWSRIRQVAVAGVAMPTLDPECALLALCAHGAKEGWPRLSQILDVGELVRAHPDLDWEWVMAEAARMKRERVLRLGLLLAATWIQAPLPPPVRSYLAEDPVASALSGEIGEHLGDDYLAGTSFHGYALRVWQHPLDRFRYLWYIARLLPDRIRALAAPSEEDRKVVDLRGPLSFLYVFIRPVRAVFQKDLRLALRRFGRNL